MTPMLKRLLLLLLVVSVGAAILWWPGRGPGPDPASAGTPERPRTGRGPSRVVSAATIPDLDLDPDAGPRTAAVVRDVFRFYVRPTPVPTPAPPPPTPVPRPGDPRFVGPLLPLPTPAPTPIVPPAIPYRVTGIFGPRDNPIVALEESGRLIVARQGDVLDNRFTLRKVGRESVDFSFVGLPPEITRRLPVPQ